MKERIQSKSKLEAVFSPLQQRVLDELRIYSGDGLEFELQVNDLMEPTFLRGLAALELPVEIACYEGINGLAKISTGKVGVNGWASAGDEKVHHRIERGRFNIHSHLHDTETDLCPSEGDLIWFSKRSRHIATPSVIINSFGLSISGYNPLSRQLDDALRDKYHQTEDELTRYHLEQGGWQLRKINFIRADLESKLLNVKDLTVEKKLGVLYWLTKKLGIILEAKDWDSVTPNDMALAFNTKVAEAYWKTQTDEMIEKINVGEITPQTLLARRMEIEAEFWQLVDSFRNT